MYRTSYRTSRASTQPNEKMDDSKETSSARLDHATFHKNNCVIDFACAVRTHSCYVSLSFLIHTIGIYIYMDINPFPTFVLPNLAYNFKDNLC